MWFQPFTLHHLSRRPWCFRPRSPVAKFRVTGWTSLSLGEEDELPWTVKPGKPKLRFLQQREMDGNSTSKHVQRLFVSVNGKKHIYILLQWTLVPPKLKSLYHFSIKKFWRMKGPKYIEISDAELKIEKPSCFPIFMGSHQPPIESPDLTEVWDLMDVVDSSLQNDLKSWNPQWQELGSSPDQLVSRYNRWSTCSQRFLFFSNFKVEHITSKNFRSLPIFPCCFVSLPSPKPLF